jgi:hypothetical protein
LSRFPLSELLEGLYPNEASSAECFASNSAERRDISSSTCFFLAFCSALLPFAAAFFRLVSLSWSLDFSFLFYTHKEEEIYHPETCEGMELPHL